MQYVRQESKGTVLFVRSEYQRLRISKGLSGLKHCVYPVLCDGGP